MTDIHDIEVGRVEVRLRIGGENTSVVRMITAKDIIGYKTMRGAIERSLVSQYREAWDKIFEENE